MRVVLEITSEPAAGKKLWLRAGQAADVGRSDHAAFAVPDDNWMSSLHFRIESDALQCRLCDLDSRNGTTVNGRRVARAVLADGDIIVAGETCFRVSIQGAASPDPTERDTISDSADVALVVATATGPRHRVGHWVCGGVPEGWEIVPEKGMRNTAQEEFPTSLVFTENGATENISLQEHVDTLIQLYLDALPGCRTDGATAAEVEGAAEARQFLLEYPQRGDVALRQRYLCVQQGDWIGMAVLTTSLTELEKSNALLDRILAELAWEA